MQPPRVLIADDDALWCQLMVLYLQRYGYEVAAVEDGGTALTALQTQTPFDILVTDLSMPGLGGLELARAAQQLPASPAIIVVTGTATLDAALTALREERIADYLVKPLKQMGELLLAVTRAVSWRRRQLECARGQKRLAGEVEQLRAVLANMGQALLAADGNGVLCVVNPAASRLLGSAHLEGQAAQASLPAPLATLLAHWQASGGQHPLVTEVPWPPGTRQTVSVTALAANGWVMVLCDSTHLHRQEVGKLQRLKETAHHLQFPLARAIFTLTALKEVAETHSPSATEAYYRLVKLWGQIQGWGDGLLNVVQLAAGGGLQLMAVDLTTVLAAVQQGPVRWLLHDKQLQLVTALPPVLPLVRADPALLQQLLQGLLQRAAGRSAVGGTLHITAREQHGHVWLEMRDAGPPLPETDWLQGYEKSPSEAPLDLAHPGLELVLAQSIMAQMSGQIWVGPPGQPGNPLTLCLPAIAPPAPALAAP